MQFEFVPIILSKIVLWSIAGWPGTEFWDFTKGNTEGFDFDPK